MNFLLLTVYSIQSKSLLKRSGGTYATLDSTKGTSVSPAAPITSTLAQNSGTYVAQSNPSVPSKVNTPSTTSSTPIATGSVPASTGSSPAKGSNGGSYLVSSDNISSVPSSSTPAQGTVANPVSSPVQGTIANPIPAPVQSTIANPIPAPVQGTIANPISAPVQGSSGTTKSDTTQKYATIPAPVSGSSNVSGPVSGVAGTAPIVGQQTSVPSSPVQNGGVSTVVPAPQSGTYNTAPSSVQQIQVSYEPVQELLVGQNPAIVSGTYSTQ